MRLTALAVATGLATGLATAAQAEDPLLDLAEVAPVGGASEMSFVDVSAIRPLRSLLYPDPDPFFQSLNVWAWLDTGGFPDPSYLPVAGETLPETMGFALSEVDGLASWGRPPETGAVFLIPGALDNLPAILAARGFETRRLFGVETWGIGDDDFIDIERRNEDWFIGPIGQAIRHGIRGDLLYMHRTWAGLADMLSGGVTAAQNPDIRAILAAAYQTRGLGLPFQARIIRDRPPRLVDPAELGADADQAQRVIDELQALPALPAFSTFGLVEWQAGRRLTGALAIAYPLRSDAERAAEIFDGLLETRSLATRMSFREIFEPLEQGRQIIEAEGRFVLFLTFGNTIPADSGPFAQGRTGYRTLLQMHYVRDLPTLIGY